MVLVLTFFGIYILYGFGKGGSVLTIKQGARPHWWIKLDVVSQKEDNQCGRSSGDAMLMEKKSQKGMDWGDASEEAKATRLANQSLLISFQGKYIKLVESGLICLTLLNWYTCVIVCCCLIQEEFGAQSWSWITFKDGYKVTEEEENKDKLLEASSDFNSRRWWSKEEFYLTTQGGHGQRSMSPLRWS